mgnify:CR=1 FL=1
MSLPHTGQLEARIKGHLCQFNGDVWTTPDPELTELLNGEMEYVAKHHATINEIAAKVIRHARLEPVSEILWFKCDEWKDELPPGAID